MIDALAPVLSLIAVVVALAAAAVARQARVILGLAARREILMAQTLDAIGQALAQSPHDEALFDVRVAYHEGADAMSREMDAQQSASRWRLPPAPWA